MCMGWDIISREEKSVSSTLVLQQAVCPGSPSSGDSRPCTLEFPNFWQVAICNSASFLLFSDRSWGEGSICQAPHSNLPPLAHSVDNHRLKWRGNVQGLGPGTCQLLLHASHLVELKQFSRLQKSFHFSLWLQSRERENVILCNLGQVPQKHTWVFASALIQWSQDNSCVEAGRGSGVPLRCAPPLIAQKPRHPMKEVLPRK